MEFVEWANGNGHTLTLTQDETEGLLQALKEAIVSGRGNYVSDYSEIDIVVDS